MGTISLIVGKYDSRDNLCLFMRRVSRFQKAGMPLIWLIDNDERIVTVFGMELPFRLYAENEELTGGDVITGLRCPVPELLRDLEAN